MMSPKGSFEAGKLTMVLSQATIFMFQSLEVILTLKLAGYFAKHIQARGGFVDPPPKNFETANN